MLCADVKRVAYFFLDESLGDTRRQTVEMHLHDCPDCGVRIVVQRKLRIFVRKRLAPVAAPDALRVRLERSLRALTNG
jgi:anti-sigma factor RsiW